MTVKEQIRQMVDHLPDECTFEDAQYQLYVMEKVRLGLKDADEGRVIPHEKVKEMVATWIPGK